MNDFAQQRFALVTGGGSGLGRAFSLRLASEGWYVVVGDINEQAVGETLAEIEAAGGVGRAEVLDVGKLASWQNVYERLRREIPKLDLLVNNAGVTAAGRVGHSSIDDYLRVVNVNLHGAYYGCHTLLPWMEENAEGGHIVNVASIFGVISPPTMAAYNIAKAGVISLSETLYGELRDRGIGVTVAAPGFFVSSLLESGRFAEDCQREIAEEYMLRSQVTAEDVVVATLTAMRRRKLYVVLGRKSLWLWRLKRWIPARLLRRVAGQYRRLLRSYSAGDCRQDG